MPSLILHPYQRLKLVNLVTEIDFTGAMYVGQLNTEAKVYICLLVCATSLAIHLKVVTDLSVETFLLAFE